MHKNIYLRKNGEYLTIVAWSFLAKKKDFPGLQGRNNLYIDQHAYNRQMTFKNGNLRPEKEILIDYDPGQTNKNCKTRVRMNFFGLFVG